MRAAEDRFTRKEATGRALDDARYVLSETFTLGSGSTTLASLTEKWRRPPTTTGRLGTADTADVMRRLGGDRKLRPTRPHGPPSAMMIRGTGLGSVRALGDREPPGVGRSGAAEDDSDGGKLSQAERERQRIRATMASMRNEVMGVGATESPPPPSTRSSGLLEEAASRGARMRQSREFRLTGGVQSTSESTWGARKPTVPRRGPEVQAAPPTASQEFFSRPERRVVRAAPSSHPVTQSALGFDSWTVRRSSQSVGEAERQSEPAATSPREERQRQRFGDLEIVDDDTMGELMSDLGTVGGKAASVGRSPVKGAPITEQEGCELKELMFGSTGVSFNPEWTKQGLTFNKTDNITYGIVQHKVSTSAGTHFRG